MKIPFVDYTLYSDIIKKQKLLTQTQETNNVSNSIVHTTSRSSVIINSFIGKTIAVHDGRSSVRIEIKPDMVGFKLGCFVFTKKLGQSIHNSEHNRKKIEKMRRKITQKKVRKTTQKTPKTTSTAKKKK
uniref:Ribosomal protein S19 n=1 Tax=Didymium iridis TaxID=5793 RepID=D3X9X7_9MYCE|nr:ribosomal protein S19 [Didymium iridis]ADD25168.1 ribosomal protein S19 [Didymium iridis]